MKSSGGQPNDVIGMQGAAVCASVYKGKTAGCDSRTKCRCKRCCCCSYVKSVDSVPPITSGSGRSAASS